MPFNYNFQTDDEAISQKWNEAKIGNSNILSANLSQNQNSNLQFTIRKAQSLDAESVVRINKNSWLETYPSVEFGITRDDILTIDWEKNLEKTKNNIEKVENLYLLEINSANPETSKNWEKPEITDLKGKELTKNSTKEEVEIDQNLQIDKKLPELTTPKNQKNEIPELELAKMVILEEKSKNLVQNEKTPKINDLEETKNGRNNLKVIGFVRFGVNEENRSQIRAIYLDPDFVSLGFGTDLIIFAIEKLGFEHNFEVKAASYNQRAIRFYQKFGFKISDKKCENFELKSGKFIPQIQMLVNKDKISKKIAEIKNQAKSRGENLENEENLGKSDKKFYKIAKILKLYLQKIDTKKETFTILTPPPNLTGNLHAGHALEHFIMDSLSRFERQNGKQVLYYPGIDHAGIQLEGVINKFINNGEFDEFLKGKNQDLQVNLGNNENQKSQILETEKSKNEINKKTDTKTNSQNLELKKIDFSYINFVTQKDEDRANWLKKNFPEIWLECAWSKVNLWRDNQKNQSMVLGDSPDWDKILFTLDERAVKMVDLAFEQYWQDGLIYRDSYLINWSVALQTALSDVPEDIGRLEKVDPFVTFEYKIENIIDIKIGEPKELIVLEKIRKNIDKIKFLVATVRIETVFADIAIAIHPDKFDQVFVFLTDLELKTAKELVLTKKIEIFLGIKPLGVQNIELIIDETVDLDFGTGMLKITPAHDMADYNIAKKYGFQKFGQAIGRDGKLTEICGEFTGLSVQVGRNLVMKKLLETGFIPDKN